MWRNSLIDDSIPNVSQQLLCSCTRVPANRIRHPLNNYHALSYQQSDPIHQHDAIAKKLWKGGFVLLFNQYKGDLALSIISMNGDVGNFNIDIYIVNQSSKSNCSKSIDSIVKAREEFKEFDDRQVINNAGFDRLITFVISTSRVIGNKAEKILSDVLNPQLYALGKIGFARKFMKSIAFVPRLSFIIDELIPLIIVIVLINFICEVLYLIIFIRNLFFIYL